MRILVTGSNGFIGKNLCINLALLDRIEILKFTEVQSFDELEDLVLHADFIFHLAGVNRPTDPSKFQTGNVDLTATIVNLLAEKGLKTPIVLTSSIQAGLDNPYGNSKRAAEEILFEYSKNTGALVYIYRFPNVFGKFCRPNYNSVVATFCHNAAHEIPLRIDDRAKEMTLLYIDDIVLEFEMVIENKVTPHADGFCYCQPAYKITLGELASTIKGFANSRKSFSHKDRADELIRKLYATFISYVPEDKLSVLADMKVDQRGFFAELLRSPHFGQISVSRTKPGVVRGNHWHNTKIEKFIVIQGDGIIRFRKLDSDKITEYKVSGEKLEIIDIPPGYTHNLENTGEADLLTIFWAGELFDKDNPDTYFLEV